MRAMPVIALSATVLLLPTACGDQTAGGDQTVGGDPAGLGTAADGAGEGDVPITSRAIAAVALVHLPEDTSSRQAAFVYPEDPPGTAGAELRYRAEPGEDGDLVWVQVRPREPGRICPPSWGPCERRAVDGGELVLTWSEEGYEDPGGVVLRLFREDEVVVVGYSGPAIKGDPREQDLHIEVEMLENVVLDPRLGLRTDQDVIDAGKRLDDWDGRG